MVYIGNIWMVEIDFETLGVREMSCDEVFAG
jgi:hypothetical protein